MKKVGAVVALLLLAARYGAEDRLYMCKKGGEMAMEPEAPKILIELEEELNLLCTVCNNFHAVWVFTQTLGIIEVGI